MAKNDAGSMLTYFAHLLHLVAQIYLGVLIILVLPPIFTLVRLADGGSSFDLYASFGQHWTKLSGASISQVLMVLGVGYVVGFVVSECAYRLGTLIRYHDDFSTASEGTPEDHYRFRCSLLERPHLQKLWDWEQLQFHLCYYSEIASSLFQVALMFLLIVSCLPEKIAGTWRGDPSTLLLLWVTYIVWVVMRIARIEKLKSFREAHRAIRKFLEPVGEL